MTPDVIEELAREKDSVYQIWKDETCVTHVLASADTIKASACWRTFEARGKGITWAILDTGIKSDHPHFQQFANIDTQLSKNFSNSPSIEDSNGHGTHVAGIVAGVVWPRTDDFRWKAAIQIESQLGNSIIDLQGCPSGMAPMAKLVNIKVLDDDGSGSASNCIMALQYIRKLNMASRTSRSTGST